MQDIMHRELQKDSLFTIIGKDRVHPETTGHFIMFHEIISAIESHSNVAQITISLNEVKNLKTENCDVNELQLTKNKISFKCLENSLPFPISKPINKALTLVPFQQEFNQEILKIIGLDRGNYDLFILAPEACFPGSTATAQSTTNDQNIDTIFNNSFTSH